MKPERRPRLADCVIRADAIHAMDLIRQRGDDADGTVPNGPVQGIRPGTATPYVIGGR